MIVPDGEGGEVGLAEKGEEGVAEGEAVGEEGPEEEGGREGVEGHEGRVYGPLLLHDAAVEDDEARDRLEADEGGRRELPCVVAFVRP